MSPPSSIVWFRRDLRLADNPALNAAIERGGPVVPVFLWEPGEEAPWEPGGASRVWLEGSLRALDESLRGLGSRLVVRRAGAEAGLARLVAEVGASHVFWNRLYEPRVIERDTRVKAALKALGVDARSFNGSLLYEPTEVSTKTGAPYQVFTPFWRACCAIGDPALPLPVPVAPLRAPASWPDDEPVEALGLLPRVRWDAGIRASWEPGEAGARRRIDAFLGGAVGTYSTERDRPDIEATSRLSPHLHFGEISPRAILHATRRALAAVGKQTDPSAEHFLREVGWREFAHHLLYHFPRTTTEPLRAEFAAFPWSDDAAMLRAWQRGQTGYPIIDAGMRELWHTGWMHNRVRMIVASFLTKDLLLPWQRGAEWFWDTLVDADLASNTLGWQWAGGCGADAAPYFRVFNPTLQGKKFDPDGKYVRRWVPELARVPATAIHSPWEAPHSLLSAWGVSLGSSYPRPIVDHAVARDRALDAYSRIRKSNAIEG